MSLTANFYTLAKRKNSTKQPTGTATSLSVDLKSGTSFISPTFLLNISGTPTYNYLEFQSTYYFIRDKISVRNNLWEIVCEIDALATLKSDITSSTQYVCYSSQSGGTYLPDTRIPILRDSTTAYNTANIDIISRSGSYILSVVGQSGVDVFNVSRSTLQHIIADLQDWHDDIEDAILDRLRNLDPSVDTLEAITIAAAKCATETGFLGNKYEVAVQCIRGCHWVPFDGTLIGGTNTQIYLGNYPCEHNGGGLYGDRINTSYISGNIAIGIPWHYSDWRRTYCENAYLYLPFVGMVALNVDDIAGESSLVLKYSATPSDGNIVYEVSAGNQIIGTYGGICSMDIPIGINQKASAGSILNSLIQGTEKTVATAIQGASSVNPLGMAAGALGASFNAYSTEYNVFNTALSTNVSTVGGIGGGAGAGLDITAKCFTVARSTVVSPSAMTSTMGVPTMKPISLTGLTGYCQCANAHVSASVPSVVLDIADNYLNSGFYIE